MGRVSPAERHTLPVNQSQALGARFASIEGHHNITHLCECSKSLCILQLRYNTTNGPQMSDNEVLINVCKRCAGSHSVLRLNYVLCPLLCLTFQFYSATTSRTHLPISFQTPSRTRSSHAPMIRMSCTASLAHTIRTRTPSYSSARSSATTSRSSRSASPTPIIALGNSVNRPFPGGRRMYGLLAGVRTSGHLGSPLTVQSYVLMSSLW